MAMGSRDRAGVALCRSGAGWFFFHCCCRYIFEEKARIKCDFFCTFCDRFIFSQRNKKFRIEVGEKMKNKLSTYSRFEKNRIIYAWMKRKYKM